MDDTNSSALELELNDICSGFVSEELRSGVGQNIWYDNKLEDLDFELNNADSQHVGSVIDHNDYTISADLNQIFDHTYYSLSTDINGIFDHNSYTMSTDLNPTTEDQTHSTIAPDKYNNSNNVYNLITENQLPLMESSGSIDDSKTVHISPSSSSFHNLEEVSNINSYSTCRSSLPREHHSSPTKSETARFPCGTETESGFTKYRAISFDNSSGLNQLHINNKQEKTEKQIIKSSKKPQRDGKVQKNQSSTEVDLCRVRKFDFCNGSLQDFPPKKFSYNCELKKANFMEPKKVLYYTGIPNYEYFMTILNCLNLPYISTAAPFEMMLVTLIKIKLNLDWTDLAFRFGECEESIRVIFGFTVSILSRCVSKLVRWLPESTSGTGSRIFYVLQINFMPSNSVCHEKIFICFSNSTNSVVFISNPTTEQFSTLIDLLKNSGIMEGLKHNDIIVFDNSVSLTLHLGASKQQTNPVPPESLIFQLEKLEGRAFRIFRTILNKRTRNQVLSIKRKISEFNGYKFINDPIRCEWLNNSTNHELHCDVIRIVCGFINLCSTLPFNQEKIKILMDERKTLNVVLAHTK
ncbi:uncharacterized protein LOC120354903 [Nilaparvata lugens]|uniref:uncharacterized protein LOC120354903 n=1 Tax=Nilaparvata lugens TaxID=108931 RepID=UPI00193E6D55|nr:uncharacterized protein LOC120354903 [Nilaparvata lugens]XP_039298916.1 uncharacterized protein LOC120354903 [Nilaparvata lugens]XP_039298917.1 uncharacterized protein LOC120354903 [Nilaparvata lugens]